MRIGIVLLAVSVSAICSAQTLPSKEYIRLGGRVIAIEAPGISSSTDNMTIRARPNVIPTPVSVAINIVGASGGVAWTAQAQYTNAATASCPNPTTASSQWLALTTFSTSVLISPPAMAVGCYTATVTVSATGLTSKTVT